MKTAYNTNGSLALKPFEEERGVRLRIVPRQNEDDRLYDQILDQIFSRGQEASNSRTVSETLANLAGAPLLRTKGERRLAAIVSAISFVALFYFSFFAF